MLRKTVCLAALSALFTAPMAGAVQLNPVARDQQRITLTLPDGGDITQTQVQYTGFWHREDYALFQSARFQAEIVYAAADPYENAVLEVSLPFARARDSFAINAENQLQTGAIDRLDQANRTLFFQPYAIQAKGWSCVAVKSEWSHVGRDPRNRPAKTMFGYVCDKQGGPIDRERAAEMARSIETRGSKVDWDDDGSNSTGPIAIGNSRFPFGFGVHFNDHDGDARDG